jgi:hypothetical protein
MIDESVAKMEKFQGVFETMAYSLSANIGKLVGMEEKLNASKPPMVSLDAFSAFETTLSKLNINFIPVPEILKDIYGVLYDQLFLTKESLQDSKRKSEFDTTNRELIPPPENDAPNIEPNDDSKGFFANIFGGMNFARILAGFAIAPFVFQFARGFVGAITDGLVDLTFSGMAGLRIAFQSLAGPITRLTTGIGRIVTWISGMSLGIVALNATLSQSRMAGMILSIIEKIAPISRYVSTLTSGIAKLADMLVKVGAFAGEMFGKIPGVGVMKTLLGRFAWPVTIVIGMLEAWDAFVDTEGGMLDKFSAAAGAFVASIIGAPLDLLKDIVAFVVKKFGFEEASAALAEFSFSDKIKEMVGGVFGFLGLFADPIGDLTNLFQDALGGANTFGEWIGGIFNSVFSWISEKIPSWESIKSILPEFSIKDMFVDVMTELEQFFVDLFDFLPSMEEIKSSIMSILPDFMQPESAEKQKKELQDRLSKLQEDSETAVPEANQSRFSFAKSREEVQAEVAVIEKKLQMMEPPNIDKVIETMLNPQMPAQDKDYTDINEYLKFANAANITNLAKRDYVAANAQQGAINQGRAQSAMMNFAPQMVNTTPVTNNSSSTTIINNMSPARSLDDPSMLR